MKSEKEDATVFKLFLNLLRRQNKSSKKGQEEWYH